MIVSRQVAELAKDKGFNLECTHAYVINYNLKVELNDWIGMIDFEASNFNNYSKFMGSMIVASAPTQEQLHKWLRDKHNKFIMPLTTTENRWWFITCTLGKGVGHCGAMYDKNTNTFDTYEEMMEEALLTELIILP